MVKNIAEALQFSGASGKKTLEKAEPTPQKIDSSGKSTVSLDSISNRESDTRELNLKHVEDLAESIAALGLIEPLVVDQNYLLLAGGHRLAAITHLRESNPKAFKRNFPEDQVPARIVEFDSKKEPDRALEIEIAENEQRRDYSPEEVKAIAGRLRELGYQESEGRPKAGEKRLRPALSVIIGKSERTVRRYLNEETRTNVRVNEDKKTRTDGQVFLKRAIDNLKKWDKSKGCKKWEVALSKDLPEMLQRLESAMEEDK